MKITITDSNVNPLFGRFDDMLKSAVRVPVKPEPGKGNWPGASQAAGSAGLMQN